MSSKANRVVDLTPEYNQAQQHKTKRDIKPSQPSLDIKTKVPAPNQKEKKRAGVHHD